MKIHSLALLGAALVLSMGVHAAGDHSHHHGHDMAEMPEMKEQEAQTPAADSHVYATPTDAEMVAAFPDLGGMSMQDHMGGSHFSTVLLDRLEAQDADEGTALAWEAKASYGSELNRLWLSSEGEYEDGRTAHLDTRLYGSHAFARWWEVTAGLRQQGGEGPDRTYTGVGIQGLAPYFFELDASLWLGEGGQSIASLEAEYEILLSNRLILQPRLEMNAYGQDDEAKGVGAGLSDAEFGLRLRYEIRREFAPYLGVAWSRKFGATADMAADEASDFRVLAGLRFWF
ncbi:MAG: copper resistance protein B [Pedobacter sp.]|nr:copper resistance protein B [Pedobacter sp.]